MDFKDMDPELIAQARECKTERELAELAEQEGFELTDEQLEAFSGGKWISDCFDCSVDDG